MSNLNINPFINTETITKHILQIKSPNRDGLLLHVHNTTGINNHQKFSIRFLHLSFDKSENILVASNHTGNIVLIDLSRNKFWILPSLNTCSVIKFSTYNPAEVMLGMQNGFIYIVDIETAEITGELKCHCYPVLDITFSQNHICLSASKKEAVIWDLRTNTKIHVLTLVDNCHLTHVMFIPIVGNILACFDDDTIVIWKYGTFEVYKQIDLKEWQHNKIKSITFTRNGRAVVFAGHLPQLIIFNVETWMISIK
ncbi:hypothetical protein FQR65_LT16830 [Abscondita terminalis]|nr:hypothetical protein FQR65_LT16830 [Abscondita terminalis]